MGYYTRYNLSVDAPNYNDMEIIEQFRKENEYAAHALEEDGSCADECKWYDHEKELKAFSKKHPNLVFTLKGEGEESGDMWYKYFKGGKMQRAKAIITYEDYDPAKLE
jgi:hypothetical protein